MSSVGFWLLIYLTDVAGLGAFLAGLSLMIGRAWDAVTDPIMGWITDHTNSRWGKRRPYLLFGAIPYALAYIAMWCVPEFQNERALFAYTTIVFIVFNTCLTVIFVPYTSLTAAITHDYNERTSLTGFRMMSSQSSFLVGAALPSALVLWVVSPEGDAVMETLGLKSAFGSWAATPRAGYLMMAIFFGLIMVASIWTAFFGTRERDVEDEVLPSNVTPFTYASSILDELQGNRPFRASVLIFLLTNCAATLVAVNLPYFLQYVVQMREYQTAIISTLFVTAIAFVPFWVAVAKRYGKAETYRASMLVYVFVLCMLAFVQEGQVVFAFFVAFLGGIMHSAALLLPWTIVPDVVEFDELKTGSRREGLFYGGTTFSYKLATALAVFLSGAVLEIVGYVPNVEQTLETTLGIRTLIGPAAALLLVMGSHLSRKYPLTQEAHQKILAELKLKKALKAEGK